MADTIEILLPTPPRDGERTSTVHDLGRSVAGVSIGLRLDQSWRSYFTVVDEWEQLLRRDGAEVLTLMAGDRAGPGAERTRTDVEEWAKLVEVGVVGLGN